MLIGGMILLLIILQLFSQADKVQRPELIILGWVLFGFYMASTEGVAKAFVADITPKEIRGKSYGYFNFSIGFTALLSAIVFGTIWDMLGADFVFNLFSLLCIIPIIGLIMYSKYFMMQKVPD